MRRLYLHIYLVIVAIVVAISLLAPLAWWLVVHPADEDLLTGVGHVVQKLVPSADRPRAELEAALAELGRELEFDLAVRGADGALLAEFGRPIPAPDPEAARTGFARGGRARGTFALELPDGRWLLARHRHPGEHLALAWAAMLAAAAGAIALGAYPIARRITRRLERLRERVERLGGGDLSARVEIEGRDEVADLARSFNRAADRIERLVEAQRNVLAGASHELRSPLARIRMATELLAGDERPELRNRVARDVAELDELIGELLLASRLEMQPDALPREEVDLLALLAEESARTGADASGEPVVVRGDRRMLRRLVRNLLENARRHAGGAAVEASVRAGDGAARLRVEDRGPGVPASERERIFEPFSRPPGARETDGGVGLGLALVRQIARRHGGDALCAEREGGGLVVEVQLPTGARPA
jgi:signal transduction histidine kinase